MSDADDRRRSVADRIFGTKPEQEPTPPGKPTPAPVVTRAKAIAERLFGKGTTDKEGDA